ncbi:MAG: hypothetical protein AAF907_06690, partial [Planctomycetota bacterium]
MPRFSSLILFLSAASAVTATAGVTPAPIFGDFMVFQAERPAPIFGSATPGEKVVVTVTKKVGPGLYDDGSVVTTTAADDGRWLAEVGPFSAGEELAIAITAGDGRTITFTDVLAGDVWLCSGQSNMEWPLNNTLDGDREAKAATDDSIRLFTVPKNSVREPQFGLKGEPGRGEPSAARWVKLSPAAANSFSAVGYHFGKTVRNAVGRPIGLIDSSWGGTPSEAWTRRAKLEQIQSARPLLERWEQYDAAYEAGNRDAGNWAGTYGPLHPHHPSNLNHGMIAPLVPVALSGAIWYQGESNAGRAEQYDD